MSICPADRRSSIFVGLGSGEPPGVTPQRPAELGWVGTDAGLYGKAQRALLVGYRCDCPGAGECPRAVFAVRSHSLKLRPPIAVSCSAPAQA